MGIRDFTITNQRSGWDFANFQNPNSQLASPAFGSISSTGNSTPRQRQFAAKLLV
jgi:hypothetical protein